MRHTYDATHNTLKPVLQIVSLQIVQLNCFSNNFVSVKSVSTINIPVMLVMLLFSVSLAGSAVCEDEADATGSYIVTTIPRMRSQRSASETSSTLRYITRGTPESVEAALESPDPGKSSRPVLCGGSSNLGAITPSRGVLWGILDMPTMLITITAFRQTTPRHTRYPASIRDFQEQEGAGMV